MLSAVVAAIALHTPMQTQQLALYRGTVLPGQAMRYWDVIDTSLNTLEQDKIYGGMQSVPVGSGKAFLIRFGDLRRAIGPNKKVVKASIRLGCWGTAPLQLREVGVLLAPWGEGPLDVPAPWAQTTPKPGQKAPEIQWASNWKLRRTGENSASWQSPGAQGPRDYKQIPEARQTVAEKDQIVVSGLEAAVQNHYERPDTNYGFVLRFDGVSEALTSQSADSRPRLELELADAEAAPKGDLSVTQIEFLPQSVGTTVSGSTEQIAEQDGQQIAIRTSPQSTRPWPRDGESMNLTAYIKNVGSAPVNGYSFHWVIREQAGIVSESQKTIQPGEVVKITTQVPYRSFHQDHRINPVAFSIDAKEADANLANNSLTVQLNALSLKVVLDKATYEALSKLNMLGSKSPEDYIQETVDFINHTVFPQSVFGTALEGALETLRIQSVEVVDSAAQVSQATDTSVDGVVRLTGFTVDTLQISPDLIRQVLLSLGVPDLRPNINNGEFGPKAPDIYPGLLGGDTRNSAYVPPLILLNNKPMFDPLLDAFYSEDTDLLSGTIVNTINENLGRRNGYAAHPMWPMPIAVQLQFLDRGGKKLANADLTIYQTAGSKLDENRVLVRMKTDEEGTIILPKRAIGATEPLKTATGQNIVSNIFGRLDPKGSNAMIAIKVEANGQTDWMWLKAWQLSEAAKRTPAAVILPMRMNFSTTSIDTTANVAKNRIVTDSSNQGAVNLAALVDENLQTGATFGGQIRDWIEIDLGRDRVVGEIQLLSGKDPFWESFDIFIYATGQTPEQALLWSREKSWSWSYAYGSNMVAGDVRSVGYRGTAQRFRYIRIVNRSQVSKATLNEIRAFPIVREGG